MPTSINKKRESEILKLIKSKAKIYNWNGRGFQIFKIVEQFLFSASIFVDGKNNSLNGIMQFKPSNIDNLFCEIIDKEDYFRTGPLFYKVNSSGMVYPYYCYEFTLNEINESKLEKLINEFEEKIEYVIKNFSDKDNYYQFIKEQLENRKGSGVQQTFLTNLVYLKKYDLLLEYINYCKKNNIDSGISRISFDNPMLSWDYYDKLIEYVNRQSKLENS